MNTFFVEIEEFVGPFKAQQTGETWNGWECPAFDFDTAASIMLSLIDQGQVAGYDEPSRTFFVVLGDSGNVALDTLAGADEDAIETYGPLRIAPLGVFWPIGAWGWCWQEASPAVDDALARIESVEQQEAGS